MKEKSYLNVFGVFIVCPITGYFMITDNLYGVIGMMLFGVGLIMGYFIRFTEVRPLAKYSP